MIHLQRAYIYVTTIILASFLECIILASKRLEFSNWVISMPMPNMASCT